MDSSLSGNVGSIPPNLIHDQEVGRHVLSLFRSRPSFQDMKIVLRDGEVFANSAVLADVSDYFATMLNNPNFVESQTKEVLMLEYGTVKAMGQIVDYVYTGVMKLDEEIAEGFMDFENLLEILNILRMMLMKDDKLYRSIETYITVGSMPLALAAERNVSRIYSSGKVPIGQFKEICSQRD